MAWIGAPSTLPLASKLKIAATVFEQFYVHPTSKPPQFTMSDRDVQCECMDLAGLYIPENKGNSFFFWEERNNILLYFHKASSCLPGCFPNT
jgi:hypothetical protein